MTFERKLEKSKQKKVDFEKSSSEVLEQLKAIEEKRKSKQEKFDNVKNEMNKLHKVWMVFPISYALQSFEKRY